LSGYVDCNINPSCNYGMPFSTTPGHMANNVVIMLCCMCSSLTYQTRRLRKFAYSSCNPYKFNFHPSCENCTRRKYLLNTK